MNSYKNLIYDSFDCDVWKTLRSSENPILIYGMGNGADKIISAFEGYGITYCDVFASDGFVRGHSYRGKRVLSYSEACEKYGSFDIVVSFGSKLPDVISRIFSLEEKHRVYAPDVPVCQGEIFTDEFFTLHEKELFEARLVLSDEKSRLLFDNIIRFKLTGKLKYLRLTACEEDECDALLNCKKYGTYVDLGAYNGDTVKKYTSLCPSLKEIYAFEPDKRNYKKLCAVCEGLEGIQTFPLNIASYSRDTTLEFSASGNRNSSAASQGSYQHKTIEIEAKAVDSVCSSADFIKYDVEGLEYEALLGSEGTIKTHSPDLLVSMYHKSEDMYLLPLLVHKLNPSYSLLLRRLPYIPAWNLNLYAIKKATE